MIGKVDNSPPKSMGDLELRQNDADKSKSKRSPHAVQPESDAAAPDEPGTLPPVNIRYLGKNLDLVI